jgi:hypothetical protein
MIFCLRKLQPGTREALATSRAKAAAKHLSKTCRKETLSAGECMTALRDYLNQRLGLSLGTLTSDEAAAILATKGVSSETIERFRKQIRSLEDAVYTGRTEAPDDVQSTLPGIVNAVEKELQ